MKKGNPKRPRGHNWPGGLAVASAAPRCGAKTRKGAPCKAPAMPNGRCRMHGGKSPGAPCGPRHGRYRHGLYTKQARALRAAVRALLRRTKALEDRLKKELK